jgi:hypothetical protein
MTEGQRERRKARRRRLKRGYQRDYRVRQRLAEVQEEYERIGVFDQVLLMEEGDPAKWSTNMAPRAQVLIKLGVRGPVEVPQPRSSTGSSTPQVP